MEQPCRGRSGRTDRRGLETFTLVEVITATALVVIGSGVWALVLRALPDWWHAGLAILAVPALPAGAVTILGGGEALLSGERRFSRLALVVAWRLWCVVFVGVTTGVLLRWAW